MDGVLIMTWHGMGGNIMILMIGHRGVGCIWTGLFYMGRGMMMMIKAICRIGLNTG